MARSHRDAVKRSILLCPLLSRMSGDQKDLAQSEGQIWSGGMQGFRNALRGMGEVNEQRLFK
jgi:hypothetical protein